MKVEFDVVYAVVGVATYCLYRIYVRVAAFNGTDKHPGEMGKIDCRAGSAREDNMKLFPAGVKIVDGETAVSQVSEEQISEPAVEPEEECGPVAAVSVQVDRQLPAKVYTICLPLLIAGVYLLPTLLSLKPSTEHAYGYGRGLISPPGNGELLRVELRRQKSVERLIDGVMIEYKSAYYGTVNMGSPMDGYTLMFDTGSGHVFVPSSQCHSDTCKMRKRFNGSASATAVSITPEGEEVSPGDPMDEIEIGFGTGFIAGSVVEDILCTGTAITSERNSDVLPPGCTKMRVITATEMSADPFDDFAFDGILGLGMVSLAYRPELNFLFAISQQMKVPQTFGLFLANGFAGSSELSFGGWDADRLEGGADLAWSLVAHADLGHWLIKVKSLRIDNEDLKFCDDDCYAVVDSGTALLSVPSASFYQIGQGLSHPSSLDGECRGEGPQLHFELDGETKFTLTLGPKDYSRPQQYRNRMALGFGATPWRNKGMRSDFYCRPLLMVMDSPESLPPKLFILGEPALRKYYTVYDADAKRVGFGLARHEDESPDGAATAAAAATFGDEDDDDWFLDDDGSIA